MDTTVAVAPIGFLSHDGTSTIKGLVWEPERTRGSRRVAPRGVIQIVHGMVEHVGRYDEFARFLVEQGFVVCAADHIGHGKSVASADELGCLPVDGMFGHSMGSFVTRAYLARHGEDVAAAVICGTGQQPLVLSKAGNALARFLAKTKGADYRSKLLDGMGVGAFAKQIENPRTTLDWFCTDAAVVDAYIAVELCGAMFSVGCYATLTDLTGEVVSPSCAAKVPKGLPVLFVAGAEDPVGACGKGVRAAADLLRRAGVRDVEVKLYEGMRHEILNEPGRAQVYTEVVGWIEEHACQSTS